MNLCAANQGLISAAAWPDHLAAIISHCLLWLVFASGIDHALYFGQVFVAAGRFFANYHHNIGHSALHLTEL